MLVFQNNVHLFALNSRDSRCDGVFWVENFRHSEVKEVNRRSIFPSWVCLKSFVGGGLSWYDKVVWVGISKMPGRFQFDTRYQYM